MLIVTSYLWRCHSMYDQRRRFPYSDRQSMLTLVFESARRKGWRKRWPGGSRFSARCDVRESRGRHILLFLPRDFRLTWEAPDERRRCGRIVSERLLSLHSAVRRRSSRNSFDAWCRPLVRAPLLALEMDPALACRHGSHHQLVATFRRKCPQTLE